MQATTPRKISEPIIALCRELVRNPEPRYIRVTPVAGADVDDCFPVIERQVQRQGGSTCYGWQIWEWHGIMIEAEFHAVWKDAHDELHDITPKALPLENILFLPDPERIYTGQQVNNVRRATSQLEAIRRFIAAADAEFEFMNRGARAEQHGEIRLTIEEAKELRDIRESKSDAYREIIISLPKPGRNDPCPCGSGAKFKKCHGRNN
jgi:hypothetical protein